MEGWLVGGVCTEQGPVTVRCSRALWSKQW